MNQYGAFIRSFSFTHNLNPLIKSPITDVPIMYKRFSLSTLAVIVLNATLLSALMSCSVNPVTGKQELAWVDENWERKIGEQHYSHQQQAGGGPYTIDPDLTLYVRSVGKKLAQYSKRSHLPYDFIVLNDSSPNAWALPGGKIAVNRGLLISLKDEAELAAVLAHEIVHADARHSAQSQEVGSLISVGQLAANVLLSNSGYSNKALQQGIAYNGLYGQTRYSRSRELEADLYGMQYMSAAGYNPEAAVSLQKTFVALSKGRQSDAFSALFASHPPSQSRVAANEQTAWSLKRGGERGKTRYQQEIKKLMDRKPAYDLSDKAKKAIGDKKYAEAIRLAEQAIKIEPKESEFYEVKGAAETKLNRSSVALKSFDQAIALNNQYYSPILRRGILRYELRSYESAERDLQASLLLAPTQIAYIKLGEIAEEKDLCAEANKYYQLAAKASPQNQQSLQQKLLALQARCR